MKKYNLFLLSILYGSKVLAPLDLVQSCNQLIGPNEVSKVHDENPSHKKEKCQTVKIPVSPSYFFREDFLTQFFVQKNLILGRNFDEFQRNNSRICVVFEDEKKAIDQKTEVKEKLTISPNSSEVLQNNEEKVSRTLTSEQELALSIFLDFEQKRISLKEKLVTKRRLLFEKVKSQISEEKVIKNEEITTKLDDWYRFFYSVANNLEDYYSTQFSRLTAGGKEDFVRLSKNKAGKFQNVVRIVDFAHTEMKNYLRYEIFKVLNGGEGKSNQSQIDSVVRQTSFRLLLNLRNNFVSCKLKGSEDCFVCADLNRVPNTEEAWNWYNEFYVKFEELLKNITLPKGCEVYFTGVDTIRRQFFLNAKTEANRSKFLADFIQLKMNIFEKFLTNCNLFGFLRKFCISKNNPSLKITIDCSKLGTSNYPIKDLDLNHISEMNRFWYRLHQFVNNGVIVLDQNSRRNFDGHSLAIARKLESYVSDDSNCRVENKFLPKSKSSFDAPTVMVKA